MELANVQETADHGQAAFAGLTWIHDRGSGSNTEVDHQQGM